jgi:hypothetical protein
MKLDFEPIVVGYREVDEMRLMPSSASLVFNIQLTGRKVSIPIYRCQHDDCMTTDEQDNLQCHNDDKLVAHYCSGHRSEHGFCYVCGGKLDKYGDDMCGECLYWSSDLDGIS